MQYNIVLNFNSNSVEWVHIIILTLLLILDIKTAVNVKLGNFVAETVYFCLTQVSY